MTPRRLAPYLRPGLQAIRSHWIPFCLVQACSLTLVLLYYHHEPFMKACSVIGEWKSKGGLLAAALATVIGGALAPEIAKLASGQLKLSDFNRSYAGNILSACAFYVINGILVDLFYQLQTVLFGDDPGVITVLCKIAMDQFVFSAFLMLPIAVIFFLWVEERLSFPRCARRLDMELMRRRGLSLLLPNWVYWIPMTACIYALPSDLQFPLFTTALAAWSLIFISVARRPDSANPVQSAETVTVA